MRPVVHNSANATKLLEGLEEDPDESASDVVPEEEAELLTKRLSFRGETEYISADLLTLLHHFNLTRLRIERTDVIFEIVGRVIVVGPAGALRHLHQPDEVKKRWNCCEGEHQSPLTL